MEAINLGKPQTELDRLLAKFSADCDDNRCDKAAMFLLNALEPKGSYPNTHCDILDFMY